MPTCSGCHKPLPVNAPQGLCPECLLKVGLGTGVDLGPDTQSQPAGGSRGFVPPSPEELGRFFPQMEITRLLGRGGMGAVYQARQKQLDRVVALKILPPSVSRDPAFAERFAREARALAKLTHPHIVTLYEFGQADGLFYFLMEFVDGVSLRQLLQASRVSPREALAIVPQICDALQYAHDRGIVHRDIKPENVLLNREGQVKITDFGVARIMGLEAASPAESSGSPPTVAALTEAGRVVGTPQYMAPEQVTRPLEVDHRADIYSLGVVFYQMLTGELPGKTLEAPSRKVQIDVRLDEVVLHALERDPARRYQQVSEVKTAVQTLRTPPPAVPEQASEPSASWLAARRRLRVPANALMVLGILGVVLCSVVRARNYWRGNLPLEVAGISTFILPLPPSLGEPLQWFWLLFPILYLLMAVGAARMRRLESYGVAVTGGVFAVITLPLLPLTLPLGLWALLVLARKGVREEFGKVVSLAGWRGAPAAPRLSKLAVASVALGLVPVFLTSLSGVSWHLRGASSPASGLHLLAGSIGFCLNRWPRFGALLLGWIALGDIRRSRGALRGAGPALFGLLAAPTYWTVQPFFLRIRDSPHATTLESLIFALTADLFGLALCATLALWVHRQEAQRLAAGHSSAFDNWWLFSRPAIWLSRAFACGIIYLSVTDFVQPQLAITRSQANLAQVSKTLDELNAHFNLHADSPPAAQDTSGSGTASRDIAGLPLLALSDVSTSVPVCWRPDGTPLCSRAPDALSTAGRGTQRRRLALSFARTKSPDNAPWLPFMLRIAGKQVAADGTLPRPKRQYILFEAAPEAATIDLRVAQRVRPWRDTPVAWQWNSKLPSHPEQFLNLSGQEVQVRLQRVQDVGRMDRVEVSWVMRPFLAEWAGRVVAVDDEGVTHAPSAMMPGAQDTARARTQDFGTVYIDSLSSMRIKELRLQVCERQWVEVRNISLQPGQLSQVEVVEAGGWAPPAPASQSQPVAQEEPRLKLQQAERELQRKEQLLKQEAISSSDYERALPGAARADTNATATLRTPQPTAPGRGASNAVPTANIQANQPPAPATAEWLAVETWVAEVPHEFSPTRDNMEPEHLTRLTGKGLRLLAQPSTHMLRNGDPEVGFWISDRPVKAGSGQPPPSVVSVAFRLQTALEDKRVRYVLKAAPSRQDLNPTSRPLVEAPGNHMAQVSQGALMPGETGVFDIGLTPGSERRLVGAIRFRRTGSFASEKETPSPRLFSPVFERVVMPIEDRTNCFLDLETGGYRQPHDQILDTFINGKGDHVARSEAMGLGGWMQWSGADLLGWGDDLVFYCRYLSSEQPVATLAGFEFDHVSAEAVAGWARAVGETLDRQNSLVSPFVRIRYQAGKLNTYLFRTIDRQTDGVLQCLGKDPETAGIRIRYRLAQAPGVPHERHGSLQASTNDCILRHAQTRGKTALNAVLEFIADRHWWLSESKRVFNDQNGLLESESIEAVDSYGKRVLFTDAVAQGNDARLIIHVEPDAQMTARQIADDLALRFGLAAALETAPRSKSAIRGL